jgi:hypothetical protein
MKNVTVGVSNFVKRQTKDSKFTHYQGDWIDLSKKTAEEFKKGNYIKGYRDGVFIVHMPLAESSLFLTYNEYPMFEGMRIDAQWGKTPGREHEPAKLQLNILEPKIPCRYVDIIIYAKEVLLEDKDEITGADFDIVSINGRISREAPPMDPMTLVRNWLHLEGGTEMKEVTNEEMLTLLCDSILYKNGMKKHMSKNK